jgi:hypothetical protein
MSNLRVQQLQHPSASTPALALANDGAAAAQLSAINGGPLAGFRNAIINGNFDVWQRGTSFSASAFAADRWLNGYVGSSAVMSRQAFTLGQTDVPGEPRFFSRAVVTSVAGASNYSIMLQRIEGVRTFAGQTVTISFWAKADAARSIAVELAQWFGTGGSPSAMVTGIGATKFTIGTAWQQISLTVNVPSIAGKTLGTAGDDYLALNIWFDGGSSFNARNGTLGQQSGTFDIARVQVEPGGFRTPFELRPLGTELALCQRYYEKSYDLDTTPGTATDTGLVGGQCVYYFSTTGYAVPAPAVTYRVTKRGTPQLTFWNRSGTAGQYSQYYNGVWANQATAPVVLSNSTNGLLVYPNAYVSSMNFHFAADAELV